MEQKNNDEQLLRAAAASILLNILAIFLMCRFGADVKDTIPISALISCSLFPVLKAYFTGNHKDKKKLTYGGYVIIVLYIFAIIAPQNDNSVISNLWYSLITLGFFYGILLAFCGTIYNRK
ncbi:hypothetical protein ERK14_02965 [Lactobacillus kunkeei]|uniref:hypothetical protein n=1 Tax=Apilactobacillus nanyangensis TaxID=2799579 RepID=UPI00110C7557|nr:hypothetical protein [Apilactobacillus nanyangensis]MBC6388525.1 hypothetical protein [Apilactobacillus kunkeei]TMT02345.1 hypothetical protein FD687_02500 [Apilactobacillus kunkeei]TMT04081.1 hypothetical protein FD689_02330 [Apilactobacillus kunkeei]CAI2615904.1 hypothetical protein AKUA1404_01350 [Apilactobacillus kunkeei]